MKKMILILALSAIWASAPAGAAPAENYLLEQRDTLSVSVWGIDELQLNEVPIRDDGRITVPLAGEVGAAGLTIAGLTETLTKRLGEYIKDPRVTVNVKKFHTTRVYVLGEVNKPGLYELEKQHNLLDAIGIANGYTKKAAKKQVAVIRNDKAGKPAMFNLQKILKEGEVSQNVRLEDGDVVYLSSNGRIDFIQDVVPILSAAYYVKNWGEN